MDLIGRKLGKYEITELIGQGGMATVYKAFQPGVERDVAIKVMYPHLATSADFVSRFQREARSAGNLQHPHIVSVIDFDEEAGVHYLVLPFIQGGALDAYIRDEKKLLHDVALNITAQIADALSFAHERGMIHRDIKPANIMFLAPDRQHALLADFGIAHLKDDASAGLTATGALVGTPNYMSPEAAQGEKCDERSDIYSLGVVLYEMVTGRTPYEADTPYSFLMKQANDPLPSPRESTPDLPDSVAQLILKSLEKDPADRYQTATEFFDAANAALTVGSSDSDATSASRRSTPTSAAKAKERERSWLPLALSAAGVLLVAILTVVLITRTQTADPANDPTDNPAVASNLSPTDAATSATAPDNEPAAEPPVEAEVAEAGPAQGEPVTDERVDDEPVAEGPAATEPVDEDTVGREDTIAASEEESPSVVEGDAENSTPDESTSELSAVQEWPAEVTPTEESVAEDTILEDTVATEPDEEAVAPEAFDSAGLWKMGQLRLQPGDGADQFELRLNQVELPPRGNHYELWLRDAADTALNLGALSIVDNAISYTGTMESGQLETYSSALISIEADDVATQDVIGTIAYTSTLDGQTAIPVFDFFMEPAPLPESMADAGIPIDMLTAEVGAQPVSGSFRLALRQAEADTGGGAGYGGGGDGYGEYAPATTASAAYVMTYTVGLESADIVPDRSQYQAWMSNEQGALFELGILADRDGHLSLLGSTQHSLLEEFDRVLITLRPTDAAPPESAADLGDTVVYRGQYQAEVLAALQAAYYPSDAYASGLLSGADKQLELAITHTGFARTGVEDADLAEAQRHAEHVVNILVGKDGQFYGDLDRDGLAQNPGDGVGAMTYSAALVDSLVMAAQSATATPQILFYAQRALVSYLQSEERTVEALEKALQIFAADTVAEANPFVGELAFLLHQAMNGRDLDGNGVVDPVRNEGGLRALQTYMELLTEVQLVAVP